MPLEFTVSLSILVLGTLLFRGFQGRTPVAVTVRKWVVYFALVFALTMTVGRPWSLLWTLSPVFGLVVHFAWCFRHRIHPFTAEPRDRYFALRGWTHLEKGHDS
jgi:hypothetical protein